MTKLRRRQIARRQADRIAIKFQNISFIFGQNKFSSSTFVVLLFQRFLLKSNVILHALCLLTEWFVAA